MSCVLAVAEISGIFCELGGDLLKKEYDGSSFEHHCPCKGALLTEFFEGTEALILEESSCLALFKPNCWANAANEHSLHELSNFLWSLAACVEQLFTERCLLPACRNRTRGLLGFKIFQHYMLFNCSLKAFVDLKGDSSISSAGGTCWWQQAISDLCDRCSCYNEWGFYIPFALFCSMSK